ncbi:hypothetical protein Acr_23g0017710 [Actinidia rufa]|uniref:Uncharacterized protein n=1 Tax=Actinidia rufa TaxID=165716 RepID=A0A7J0GRF0_9ERIC|nr:hypothetical protein Acr_23g0017710 [Actinidia rufa]
MEVHILAKAFISLAFVGFLGLFLRLYSALVAEPRRLRSKLKKQGISGPPPSFLLGNIGEIKKARTAKVKDVPTGCPPTTHDCAVVLFPFFEKWRKLYGTWECKLYRIKLARPDLVTGLEARSGLSPQRRWRAKFGQVFMFSLGNIQILHVNQPDMVREITTCTSLDLGKPSYQQKERGALLGQGILTSNGTVWAHQRKIIAPELYMDKVKGMMNMITESANTMLESWKSRIEAGGGIADIKIDQDMRSFSGDVISRACFGSNFSKGEEIFKKLRALQEAASKKVLFQWSSRLEASSHETQQGHVGPRKGGPHTHPPGGEAEEPKPQNPEWQERVRTEVLEVCGGRVPDDYMIRKMKQLNMVINESLRLYPPVAVVSREALTDMKFGDIHVPKGVNLWTLVVTLHTDPENWGPDSLTFNPDRFANGITGACKLPHLYMPFGVGPRVCLGQNLAMVELKLLIALVVSNFSFSLSPEYVHAPFLQLVIEPEHGVNLLVKKL